MTTWTRVSDPADIAALLPAWFALRMAARRGAFGLLLSTGDVLRVTALDAAHVSASGAVLLDVALDHAGVPDGADAAWRPKHYLGAPVPGAARATVNLAQVVAAVEFGPEQAEPTRPGAGDAAAEVVAGLRFAAEEAADGRNGRTGTGPGDA
jgi:hypothetical protein